MRLQSGDSKTFYKHGNKLHKNWCDRGGNYICTQISTCLLRMDVLKKLNVAY